VSAGSIAVSTLGIGESSREAQIVRAITWLLAQPSGQIALVTPRRRLSSESLRRLASQPGVAHYNWRGFISGSFNGKKTILAWPVRKHLNDVWDAKSDAIAVIEWNEDETSEWIEDVTPVQLLGNGEAPRFARTKQADLAPLPNGIDGILEHVAQMADGYSSSLKWNEEDMIKADMMNRPERWTSVSAHQVRAKCRQLGMRPGDVDTITDLVQSRRSGWEFNVLGAYRAFQFD